MRALTFVHFLAVSTWFGSMVFWSFIATPKIFAAHDRRTAGDIVGLVFPRYYTLGIACGAVALLTAVVLPVRGLLLPLVILSVLNVYAGVFLRGQIEKAKVERRRLEDAGGPEAEAAAKRFGQLHGVSMLINLGLIFGTSYVLWRLAGQLGANT